MISSHSNHCHLDFARKYAAAAELYCMGLQHPDMDALVTCFHYLTRQASDIRLSHSRSARHLVHMIETKLVVLYYNHTIYIFVMQNSIR